MFCIFPWVNYYSFFKPISFFLVGKHQIGKNQFSFWCLALLFPLQTKVKGEADHFSFDIIHYYSLLVPMLQGLNWSFSLVGKHLWGKNQIFLWHYYSFLVPISKGKLVIFPLLETKVQFSLGHCSKEGFLKRIIEIFLSCHKRNFPRAPCACNMHKFMKNQPKSLCLFFNLLIIGTQLN